MDVLGHVSLETTAGILPAPGASVRNLGEEEFPTLGRGKEMTIKNQLGCRTDHSKVVPPSHTANEKSWEREKTLDLGGQQPARDGFKDLCQEKRAVPAARSRSL